MKTKVHCFSFSIGYRSKFYYLFIGLIFCGFFANAQVQRPKRVRKNATVVNATTDVLPQQARNMDEFKNSPQYIKRKKDLDKYSVGPKTKQVKFADKSVINITLAKRTPVNGVGGVVKKKVGPPKKESSGGYDCTVQNVHLSSASDNFLNNDYSGSTANIYPGACYTYENLTNGSWKEQTGARNPVMITTDNPNTKVSYVIVKDPNVGTLYAAIAKLFAGFRGKTSNESLSYNVTEVENSATYNLQIGAAASGYGVDLSNVYTNGNQSNHVHVTIDATKTLFSLMTAPPDSGFFTDPKVERTPYLSVIGEVSYGVRVLANADLTFASQVDADEFKGSYSGFGVSASLKINYSNSTKNTSATINGYMIGGPGNQVVAYSLEELKNQIEKAFAGATYQNARPIKYKAYSMAGDVLNTYSATDDFAERSCIPSQGGSPEIASIAVTFTQGSDGKEAPSTYWVGLFNGVNQDADPNNAMFIYNAGWPNSGNEKYQDNGTVTVILKPNVWTFDEKGKRKGKKVTEGFKGKLDLATLQKAGGHLYISPLSYPNNNDTWKLDGVSIAITLKPTPVDPNPQLKNANSLSWNLQGPNEIQLDAHTNTHAFFFFDGSFSPQGHE